MKFINYILLTEDFVRNQLHSVSEYMKCIELGECCQTLWYR